MNNKIIKSDSDHLSVRETGTYYSTDTIPNDLAARGLRMDDKGLNDVQIIVRNRYSRVLNSYIKNLDNITLSEMASESTDDGVLLRVAASSIGTNPTLSNEAKAFLLAQETKKEMRDYRGGSIKAVEVASILNIGRQTVNDKRNKHELLGLNIGIGSGNGYLYPIWQFFASLKARKVFKYILNSLFTRGMDEWMIIGFFMGDNDYLLANCPDYSNPIDALNAGEVDMVKKASDVYMQHGAS